MMNTRTKKILYYLLDNGDVVTVASLAILFGVSDRSIRNDLKSIDEWLTDNGLSQLIYEYYGAAEPPVRW